MLRLNSVNRAYGFLGGSVMRLLSVCVLCLPCTLALGGEKPSAFDRVHVLRKKGKQREAMALLQRLLASNPKDKTICARARYYIGECFRDLKEHRKAIVEYDRVVSEYPGERHRAAWALLRAAIAARTLGDHALAVKYCDKALESYPEQREQCAVCLYSKGKSSRSLGRSREAAEAFEELVKRYPDQKEICRQGLQQLIDTRKVRLGDKAGALKAQETLVESFSTRDKASRDAMTTLAKEYERLGDFKGAART